MEPQKDQYYDVLAPGYDALYGEEQRKKLAILKTWLSVTPDMVLLDAGCGTGISTDWPCRVIGVDTSLHALHLARHKHPTARFVQAAMERLPFSDRAFDVVLALTSLQNARDINAALAELWRVARGRIVVTFPARLKMAAALRQKVRAAWPGAQETALAGDAAFRADAG